MTDNNELDLLNCKKLIIDFINDHLNGDVEKICLFSFAQLKNCKKYGSSGQGFDSDDTNLANAIYFLIWEDKLPELEFDQIGTGKKYRGDTLNTFNTLLNGIDKYYPDKELLSLVNEFKGKYVSLGNFMLMPNVSIQTGNATRTINTYRGTNSWRDYFDRFLKELSAFFTDEEKCDESLGRLIKCNDFYFNTIDTIEKFRSVNYLDSYFDSDGEIKIDFDPYLYHWKFKTITSATKETYVHFSKNYIKEASTIIDDRATLMVDRLKEKLNE